VKFANANHIEGVPEVHLSADLDWMLQSHQVSNQALAETLVETYFQPMLHFTQAVLGDTENNQEAFNRVIDRLSWAVHHRTEYWGGSSVTVWLFSYHFKSLRRLKTVKQWKKSTLRLLLCDRIGLSAAEAEAILSKKHHAAQVGSAEESASQAQLEYDRENLAEVDRILLNSSATNHLQQGEKILFEGTGDEDLVRLVWETATHAGVGRVLSRGVLQVVLIGGVLLSIIIFVLYRTVIEKEISARKTPVFVEVLVTWTPTAGGETALEDPASLSEQTPTVQNGDWVTLPTAIELSQLTGSNAEEFFKPQYSGLLALAAVAEYWGTSIDLAWLQAALQPNPKDHVVMFYELSDFIRSIQFKPDFRLGGTVNMLCRLVETDFPIIAQIGVVSRDDWQAQFVVISGCDRTREMLMVELLGLPLVTSPIRSTADMLRGEISFEQFERRWAHFADAFLVIYPEELPPVYESNYQAALDLAGVVIEENSYEIARQHAEKRIQMQSGRELFFALFSYATALVYQRDYGTASQYYDEAFRQYMRLYPSYRPYRMLWYQTRPYWAYYYTGNYTAVIDLANRVLSESIEANTLEETYYWRALAKEGLGDLAGSIADLEQAIQLNENFTLAKEQLTRILAKP
jgi:tetratricopeptide (TPR) repeat protein